MQIRPFMIIAGTILRSPWMLVGLFAEVLGLVVAISYWASVPSWIPAWSPNLAITAGALGLVIVAGKVAWDYEARGLNRQQQAEINQLLQGAGFNSNQTDLLQQMGLSDKQKEELDSMPLTQRQRESVSRIDISLIAETQRALWAAVDYIRFFHGRVAVIERTRHGQFNIAYLEPPAEYQCNRRHPDEPGFNYDFFAVAQSLAASDVEVTLLWAHPLSKGWRTTNNQNSPLLHSITVYSFENCVPQQKQPAPGDYVLEKTGPQGWSWCKR